MGNETDNELLYDTSQYKITDLKEVENEIRKLRYIYKNICFWQNFIYIFLLYLYKEREERYNEEINW